MDPARMSATIFFTWFLLGLTKCANAELSAASVMLESVLARMNERPDDVAAYMKADNQWGARDLVLIMDEYAEDGREIKIGMDMGIAVDSPCGNPRKDQVSRLVAIPASLSRYSRVEIHCVNLEFCPWPYTSHACMMNPQLQVIAAYNRARDELLEKIEDRLAAISNTGLKTTTERSEEESNTVSDDLDDWFNEVQFQEIEEGPQKKEVNSEIDNDNEINANDWTWWN